MTGGRRRYRTMLLKVADILCHGTHLHVCDALVCLVQDVESKRVRPMVKRRTRFLT